MDQGKGWISRTTGTSKKHRGQSMRQSYDPGKPWKGIDRNIQWTHDSPSKNRKGEDRKMQV